MELREYQKWICDENIRAMDEGARSALSGVFTGAGKTVMFCALSGQTAGRTLILAPLRDLVWQAADKVRSVLQEDPDIEMAEYRSGGDEWWSPRVTVACKQTLIRGRYKKFSDVRLVIVDEAHMCFSKPCLEMLSWFRDRGAFISGWTATPFRMDGTALMDFYEREICNLDCQWAISEGYAAPPECKIARVRELDLSGVRVTGGDFNQKDLSRAVELEASLHRLALITSEEMEGPTVVFTPSVASAKGVAHYLNNNYGIPAAYVYGTQPEEERNESIRRFKAGEAKVLCNCQVVAVGFDFPPIQTLILGRPTRSRSFWLQVIGRAMRPLGGVVDYPGSTAEGRRERIAASSKPHFKIVDCTDASLDHRLITAVDMFIAGESKEVREAVKRGTEKKPLTIEEMEAQAQAERERRELAQKIEAQRRQMEGQAKGIVTTRAVDLAGGRGSVGTYNNPLKGKFAGYKMSALPDYYVRWAMELPGLKPWLRSVFIREWNRRHAKVARAS